MPGISYQSIAFADVNSTYQSLLPYPLFKRIIAKRDLDRLIGYEAIYKDKPVGCIVVDHFDRLGKGTVLAWYVQESFRLHGVGAKLYSLLAENIKKPVLLTTFFQDSEEARSLISKFDFGPPQFYLEQYHFIHQNFHPHWFDRGVALPKELEIVPWKSLSIQNLAKIQRQEEQYTFEISVSPMGEEENIDLYSSLALLKGEEVVGWMVNHMYAPDTVRYSALYIEKEYRSSGAGIALLAASIGLNQIGPYPLAIFEINLSEIDPSWRKFVRKRLKPSAERVEKLYVTTKLLK